MSKPLKGMLLGFTGFSLFSVGDAVLKHQMTIHPPLQCMFFVLLTCSMAILAVSFLQGGPRRALSSRTPKLQAFRSAFMAVEFMLVFYSFSQLPLATVYALLLSAPVITVIISPLITKDRFNIRLLPAALIGFAGVLIALQPGVVPLNPAVLGALFSAFLFAAGSCLIRRMDPDEPPMTFAFYPSLVTVFVTGLYLLIYKPSMPPLSDIGLMAVTGIINAISLTLLGKAVQLAQADMVMPFQYIQLVWGAIFGFIFFGDIIDLPTAIGALLIFAGGIWLIWCGKQDRASRP
jgi:S-adenosylmethionine uptake transporter